MPRIKSNCLPLATDVNLFYSAEVWVTRITAETELNFLVGSFESTSTFKKDPIKNFFITFQGPDSGCSSGGHHSSLHRLSLFQVCGECLRGSPHILK